MPRRLLTAERYYRFSQRLAQRAVRQAKRQHTYAGAAAVVMAYQAAAAREAPDVNAAILLEQGIQPPRPTATIQPLAFTTPQTSIEAMMAAALAEVQTEFEARLRRDLDHWQFDQLVSSLVQDAARAAQEADTVSRPRVAHVRHLTPPSCSRCAVLAGRVYRYSDGFKRHPNCDCVMIPVTVASPDLTYDPAQLARDGLIKGLSQADLAAIEDGADFGQIANVRRSRAGLTVAGEVLRRLDRLTPAGIYRIASNREEALDLLKQYGYLR